MAFGRERISVEMIVQAIARGFGEVSNEMKQLEGISFGAESGITKAGIALDAFSKVAGGLIASGVLIQLARGMLDFGKASVEAAGQVQTVKKEFQDLFKEAAPQAEQDLAALGEAIGRSKIKLMEMAVALSDSVVKKELVAMGMQDLTGYALEQAEAQARLNITLRDTKQAMEAAADGSRTYEQASTSLDDAIFDLQATLAGGLTPALARGKQNLADYINTMVSQVEAAGYAKVALDEGSISLLRYMQLMGELRMETMTGAEVLLELGIRTEDITRSMMGYANMTERAASGVTTFIKRAMDVAEIPPIFIPLEFGIDPTGLGIKAQVDRIIEETKFELAGGVELGDVLRQILSAEDIGIITPEQKITLLEEVLTLADEVAAVAAGELEAIPGLLDLSQIDFEEPGVLAMFKSAGAAGAEMYATTFIEKLKEDIDFDALMKELTTAEAVTAGAYYGPEIPGVEEAEEMEGTEEALDNLGVASETAATRYGGFSDNVGESVGHLDAAARRAAALVRQQDLLTDKTVLWTILIEVQGGIPSLGSFSSTFAGLGPGGQRGANFVVPPGFPGDSFPMRVSSGEHVQVTPAGGAGPPGMSSGDQFNISFPNAAFETDFDVEDAAVRILEFIQEAKG